MLDANVNVNVDVAKGARELVDGLRQMGFETCAEHVTALADCLSKVAVGTSGSLTAAMAKLQEMAEAVRSAASDPPESNIFHSLRETITQIGGNLDTFLNTAAQTVSRLQPVVVEILQTIRRTVAIFAAISTLSSVGTLLNNLYASSVERCLHRKKLSIELHLATLEYIKTFFGDKSEAIATTLILMVKAEADRMKAQGICPPDHDLKNVFIGGQKSILAHVHALRRDPEIDVLFPPGFVASNSLSDAITDAENYHKGLSLEKKKPTFFGFHFAIDLSPLDSSSPALLRLEPIHVGMRVTEQGFAIFGGSFPGQSQIALSVKSTVTKQDGLNAPFCKHVLPQRLCNVLYHGPGYGRGIVAQARNALYSIATASSVGGIAEASMVKFGPYGFVKLVTGKCIAVKFGIGITIFAGGPLVGGVSVVGYDQWCKHWKDHIQSPKELRETLGLNPDMYV